MKKKIIPTYSGLRNFVKVWLPLHVKIRMKGGWAYHIKIVHITDFELKLYLGYLIRYSQNDCKKVPKSQVMTFSLEDSIWLNKKSFPPQSFLFSCGVHHTV